MLLYLYTGKQVDDYTLQPSQAEAKAPGKWSLGVGLRRGSVNKYTQSRESAWSYW